MAELSLQIDAEADDYLEDLYQRWPEAVEAIEDRIEDIGTQILSSSASYPVYTASDGTRYSYASVGVGSSLFLIVWNAAWPQVVTQIQQAH